MALNGESKYPSRRAYVVKVRGDAKPGSLVGRLENLVTGRQHEFASGRELLESIAADLEAIGARAVAGLATRVIDATRDGTHISAQRSLAMTMQQDALEIAWWAKNIEELDREIGPVVDAVSSENPGSWRHRPCPQERRVGVRNRQSGGFCEAAPFADDVLRAAQEIGGSARPGANRTDRERTSSSSFGAASPSCSASGRPRKRWIARRSPPWLACSGRSSAAPRPSRPPG